jgi:hypothetical protein
LATAAAAPTAKTAANATTVVVVMRLVLEVDLIISGTSRIDERGGVHASFPGLYAPGNTHLNSIDQLGNAKVNSR